jgi:crossover junction endodeoxyribonuclease RuvC
MKVLAIDPGYDRLGLAVLSRYEGSEKIIYSTCITTNRNDALIDRIFAIGKAVADALEEHTPDAVAIETLFFNTNQKTAIAVAEVRGVVLYLARARNIPIYEFGPQAIKVAVTGYGSSDKNAVIAMVRRLLPDAPETAHDDEYDAIAVGITCLAHHRQT